MAHAWLDVSSIVASPRTAAPLELECTRRALACGEFRFFRRDPQAGMHEVDASHMHQLLASLESAPPPARALTARQQVRRMIEQLPEPLRGPVLGFARRIAGVPVPAPAPSSADAMPSASPLAPGDVCLSWNPAAAPAGVRVIRPAEADPARCVQAAVVQVLQQQTGFEDRLQHLYTALLEPGDQCLDIGAHTGRHCIPMSHSVGPRGRVHAFEPNPAIAQRLRTRLAALAATNVQVHEMALSDEEGTAEFVVAVDLPEESGLKQRTIYNGPTRTERLTVNLNRLDSLGLAPPRFIKLDTEGAEFKVLQGARELLQGARPVVAFEFGEASYSAYGVDPHQVYRYLASLGYEVFSIHGEPLGEEAFAAASREQRYWDYVACQPAVSARVASVLRSFISAA